MRNSWINTDVLLFSSEEMTCRVFVFTWGISSKLCFWCYGHVSHACHTTAEPRESEGCIPSAWGISGISTWAVSMRPPHRDQSHQPALTTLPPLHPHTFVVALTQVPRQTSLPTATDAVSFAKQANFASFFKQQQLQLSPPCLLLLWQEERTVKLNSCLRSDLE